MRHFLALGLLTATATTQAQPAPPVIDGRYVPEVARHAAAEGNAAFARRDFERARRAYSNVLDLAPDNLLGLINLGVVEYSLRKLDDAEAHLKRAVQIKLDAAPAWLTLGIIYMDQNRLDEALAALAQATLYDPRNARARNYLGVVVGRKGGSTALRLSFARLLKLIPAIAMRTSIWLSSILKANRLQLSLPDATITARSSWERSRTRN